jgi:DTW domain-containing protein
MRGTAEAEPINNRLFVLVLQHPQEKREVLATAAATCAALRRAVLVVGLSWPNLARALGGPADTRQWAVLYLGSARPAGFGLEREIIMLDRAGMPPADQDAMLRGLEGVVLLDGSWSEAKTLWWRNRGSSGSVASSSTRRTGRALAECAASRVARRSRRSKPPRCC